MKTASKTASKTSEFYLRFLANEDEAEMTGFKFAVRGDRVYVSETFHFSEYETGRVQNLSKPEARQLWRKLIATGDYSA